MKISIFSSLLLLLTLQIAAQTNIIVTNTQADAVLKGNYNPAIFAQNNAIEQPQAIISALQTAISPDSLKKTILKLATFKNRNSGADTISNQTGIGAARRWVFDEFAKISNQQNGRLLPSYLQFNQAICGVSQHRNIFAVLPGTDTSAHGIVLIEGHIDSRCAVLCDINCLAEGIEDNASGTALVIELARTMSQFSYRNTLVFLITIAEEQGLFGADAFATYAKNNQIPIRAVLNNDVIGGILCGATASAPGCMTENSIDSLNVRLFSEGGIIGTSQNKQFARFTKLEYEEMLRPIAPVKMNVRIMSPEDRTGRGGDHIPFREKGFRAIRFTAANEHGNASNTTTYHDRQHTSEDVLGVDTDADGVVDSFFVDFNYLSRNAVINATSATIAARAVRTPIDFTAERNGNELTVTIEDPNNYGEYRVFLRNVTHLFDTIYTISGSNVGQFTMPNLIGTYRFISVAAVDDEGTESIFTLEKNATLVATSEPSIMAKEKAVELYQNRPNPFDAATYISYKINQPFSNRNGLLRIFSPESGKILAEIPVPLNEGVHEIMYDHGHGLQGAFPYSLLINGVVMDTKVMIFAF
jgi:Peptidase family M28